MNKRNFLKLGLGAGAATLLPTQGEASPAKPLSTAAVTKSVLSLAEKCAKAGLGQEAAILWETHRKLVALPLSVEKPYPHTRAQDEDEPGLMTSRRSHLKIQRRVQ